MQLPQNVIDIIDACDSRAFITGGAVRDYLMGREPKDFDIVVVGMNIEDMDRIFPDGKWVGKDFPVMLVNGVEVALARKERKIGSGHTSFTCETENVTLIDDLVRRDLTINAIAFNPLNNSVIDPFCGRADIKDKLLKRVSRAFSEDPLRVFRVARFTSELNGFMPSEDLEETCYTMRDSLKELPAERVFGEMMKALRSKNPSRFFITLDRMEVLDVWFSELSALKGRRQPTQWHPEGDAFTHVMLVVERARELDASDATMWAALVHDLGKAVTNSEPPKFHHFNHEALGVPLVQQMGERLRVPSDFLRIAKKVTKWHLNVHRFNIMRAVKRVDLISRLGEDVEAVTLASQADAQGRGPTLLNEPYPPRDDIRTAYELYWSVRGGPEMGNGPEVAEKLRQERARVFRENGMGK
jgi:tRNA nucleotidyltransferase (CCA-adding enzyme)